MVTGTSLEAKIGPSAPKGLGNIEQWKVHAVPVFEWCTRSWEGVRMTGHEWGSKASCRVFPQAIFFTLIDLYFCIGIDGMIHADYVTG